MTSRTSLFPANRLIESGALTDAFKPDAISPATEATNRALMQTLAELPAFGDLPALREAFAAGRAGLPASPKSPRAREIRIPGPGSEIALRVIAPEQPRGAFLHIHGGGWMVGTNDMWDEQLEMLVEASGLAAVSVDYRLAPEHPSPAAIDDCLAAALWLIDHADDFGGHRLAIGGESAGAHLVASTLLRLRDLGKATAFSAASFMFGCFDLSLSPSLRRASGTPFVDRDSVQHFASSFLAGIDPRDPAASPMYADLSDLPPALVSVGTLDPLLDDSLFFYMRLMAAGNAAQLALYPGGVHGFNSLGDALAQRANAAVARFVAESLS